MFKASHAKHALLAFGLASLIGAFTTSNASAGFHFGGGGGHFGGGGAHFSAPHFSAPRFSAPHFAGGGHVSAPHFQGGGGHHLAFGGGHHDHPSFNRGGGNRGGSFGHVARGHGDRTPTHVAHGGGDGSRRHHPEGGHDKFACGHRRPCWGGPTYVVTPPVYDGGRGAPDPVYAGGEGPTPVVYSGGGQGGPAYSAPVVKAPVQAPVVNAPPKTCDAGGTFVTVAFQPNVTAAAITAFLKTYDVVMADGPNADGLYRIRISSETVPLDQFGQMLDDMRTKTDVISSIQS